MEKVLNFSTWNPHNNPVPFPVLIFSAWVPKRKWYMWEPVWVLVIDDGQPLFFQAGWVYMWRNTGFFPCLSTHRIYVQIYWNVDKHCTIGKDVWIFFILFVTRYNIFLSYNIQSARRIAQWRTWTKTEILLQLGTLGTILEEKGKDIELLFFIELLYGTKGTRTLSKFYRWDATF
jgi:hypothetical protein